MLLLLLLGAGPAAPPVPTTAVASEKFTLGTKESVGVTGTPTVGGWWGW